MNDLQMQLRSKPSVLNLSSVTNSTGTLIAAPFDVSRDTNTIDFSHANSEANDHSQFSLTCSKDVPTAKEGVLQGLGGEGIRVSA